MTERYLGNSCPYCALPFKEGSVNVLCNTCDTYHHKECWIEHGNKCSSLNCKGTGLLVDSNPPGLTAATDTKVCPFCAETIKAQAIKCKYCRSTLEKTVPVGVNNRSNLLEKENTVSGEVANSGSPVSRQGESNQLGIKIEYYRNVTQVNDSTASVVEPTLLQENVFPQKTVEMSNQQAVEKINPEIIQLPPIAEAGLYKAEVPPVNQEKIISNGFTTEINENENEDEREIHNQGLLNKVENLVVRRNEVRDNVNDIIDDWKDNVTYKVKRNPLFVLLPLGLLLMIFIFSLKGELTVDLNVNDAKLNLSGVNETFITPLINKKLRSGTYTVTIKKDGYGTISEDIVVKRFGHTNKYYKMHPLNGVQPNSKQVSKNLAPKAALINKTSETTGAKPTNNNITAKKQNFALTLKQAENYLKNNDYNKASELLAKNEKLVMPEEKQLKKEYSNLYLLEAIISRDKTKDNNKTLELFNKANSFQETADAYYEIGYIYQKQGDCNKAQLFYKRALDLNPDDKLTRVGLENTKKCP